MTLASSGDRVPLRPFSVSLAMVLLPLICGIATFASWIPEATAETSLDASADAANDVAVGASLQAVSDVKLDQATIRKGSRVSVSGRRSVSGQVFIDVALADGHVVRAIPLPEIRRAFRVVYR